MLVNMLDPQMPQIKLATNQLNVQVIIPRLRYPDDSLDAITLNKTGVYTIYKIKGG